MSGRRGWSRVAVGMVMVAGLGLMAPDVHAMEPCPVARKLGRGVANVVFGFTELPRTMMDVAQTNGSVAGATWGLAQGICSAAARILVGAAEIVTFPFPLPNADYGPLIQPEFPPPLTDSPSN